MKPSSQNPETDSGRGEPDVYEVIWKSGHVETVIAHQVSWPTNAANLFHGANVPTRIQFHAEVDGRWTLQLSALEDDLRTVRNVTGGERIVPDGGAA
ncbi:MAG: hypothetical protein HOZ81_20085 [Streptomyces sp.]|nr:hypothetical protein [Streptomyces sp.]NUS81841.1 hypothetical protein [Streptomyces sp.]